MDRREFLAVTGAVAAAAATALPVTRESAAAPLPLDTGLTGSVVLQGIYENMGGPANWLSTVIGIFEKGVLQRTYGSVMYGSQWLCLSDTPLARQTANWMYSLLMHKRLQLDIPLEGELSPDKIAEIIVDGWQDYDYMPSEKLLHELESDPFGQRILAIQSQQPLRPVVCGDTNYHEVVAAAARACGVRT